MKLRKEYLSRYVLQEGLLFSRSRLDYSLDKLNVIFSARVAPSIYDKRYTLKIILMTSVEQTYDYKSIFPIPRYFSNYSGKNV